MIKAVTELETPPATPAGFRAIWRRLGAPRRIVLAVSGGGDSMALMHLAAPLQHSGRAKVFIGTVDHQLRSQSRAEAELVAAAARALGLSHATLEWWGEKPQTAVQATARQARYRLLVEYAHSVAADAIMTAHTADDQAETVVLRARRGSGPRGLAGMEPASLIAAGVSPSIRLLRPLLDFRRDVLRSLLAVGGVKFVEDPSNVDRRFERVRIRQDLAAREAVGAIDISTVIDEARRNGGLAQRRFEDERRRFAALGGVFDHLGSARMDRAGISSDDAPLVADLIRAVAGADHAPASASVERAVSAAIGCGRATVGGCMILVDDDQVIVCREPAAILGRIGLPRLSPIRVEPGARVLWDRRFIVSNNLGQPASVGPLGEAAAQFSERPSAAITLSTCPALWTSGELAAFPGENGEFTPLATEKFHLRVNRFH